LTPAETALLAAIGDDLCAVDTLVETSGLTADTVLAMLMALELDGRVAQLPGGLYQRLS
jgi:DNA processing protein